MLDKKCVTITLTEQCNLQCTYCYEKHKNVRSISFERAKEILDYEFQVDDGMNELEIDFFGGEPFFAFETMRKLVEYIKTSAYTKKFVFFVSTNGTLVHGDIQKWLEQNIGYIWCGLSLDGTKDSHNLNRSNSFDKIDLDFFAKTYPGQDVKMTIAENTLKKLCENVIFCHRKGFNVNCNLAYDIDWSNSVNEQELESQLMDLIDFYLKNPIIKPCSMLSCSIERIQTREKSRYCGAGIEMRTYDVEGNVYPCHFFMPISAGDKALKLGEITFYENPDTERWGECYTCDYFNICPNCYGANYVATGDIYKKDLDMCRLFKIILRANAYFVAHRIERGILHQTELSQETIDAIFKILK
ncbi:radical SAM/SPASM domain-containing protein [Pumilibacter muris]|uniref:radical SAM/SPASM domain-containing protein n=1 Tax=Pumilibacter muris TaxID=2941510 RepID=UPI002041C04B|nr:radical SAM protein [Pumilibacter muris]